MTSGDGRMLRVLRPTLHSALRASSDTVRLCSPYVSASTATWLALEAKRSSAAWTLITLLDPMAAAYGSLSVDGLASLIDAGVDVRHLPGLHAKVFVMDGMVGFAGSANLTSAGLGGEKRANHEMSVALSEQQCQDASAALVGWFDRAMPVDHASLKWCRAAAASIRPYVSPIRGTTSQGSQTQVANDLLGRSTDVAVWVKAMYLNELEADRPWPSPAFIASSKKGRPSFAIGDIVLIYAKYAKSCNAVVAISGDSTFEPGHDVLSGYSQGDADRWPWITPVTVEIHVPASQGVPLELLGLTGQSLRNGHCRMPTGGLPVALKYLESEA